MICKNCGEEECICIHDSIMDEIAEETKLTNEVYYNGVPREAYPQ